MIFEFWTLLMTLYVGDTSILNGSVAVAMRSEGDIALLSGSSRASRMKVSHCRRCVCWELDVAHAHALSFHLQTSRSFCRESFPDCFHFACDEIRRSIPFVFSSETGVNVRTLFILLEQSIFLIFACTAMYRMRSSAGCREGGANID